MQHRISSGGVLACSLLLAVLAVQACAAGDAATTAPSTTGGPATNGAGTATAVSPASTEGPDATSRPASTAPVPGTTIPPTEALGYGFRHVSEEWPAATITITYPALIDLSSGSADVVNRWLDSWAASLADESAVAAAGGPGPSVLEVELAPELRSRDVFSISGLAFEFDAKNDFSLTRRIGLILSLDTGKQVTAPDLFVSKNLGPLAVAAREHLVDVLGDEAAIVAPEALAPEPENFAALWLTPTGIGVGFDQYRVAAGEAGSPTVLIPYAELGNAIDPAGLLGALEDGTLPDGV